MKVKFKNGVIKNCTTPTEQKVFKGGGNAGWILAFAILGGMTSNEVDSLIVPENISELTFLTENELSEATTIALSEYDRISSAFIRYSDDKASTRVEIQLSKGV